MADKPPASLNDPLEVPAALPPQAPQERAGAETGVETGANSGSAVRHGDPDLQKLRELLLLREMEDLLHRLENRLDDPVRHAR
ncbi:MAG: hypothetical protein LBS49_00125, partial [Candidatus Accumulibacter sp.]|nr:hypothetical protein [Accumulibacter sp.]